MIPKDILDKIKALDISETIGKYVKLKRNGANYMGLCHFHDEKTPSFMVSPNKGIYKCYGCGEGGDIIRFIQKAEHVEFREAVEIICKDNKIEYNFQEDVADEKVIKSQRQKYIMKLAFEFYKSQMNGSASQTYAKNKRGYTDEIISKFNICHAPMGMTNLFDVLTSKGVSAKEMEECALVKWDNEMGKYKDCFRSRIMFPIHDKFGNVIAFSGRVLNDNAKPKYYNSAETDFFKKNKTLYGLHLAKDYISKQDRCIIVEGTTDVIALVSKLVNNVVAGLGTAFTPDHAKLIKTYTKNVTLLYDGDQAGLKAIFKGCQVLFKEGLFVDVCRLPEGQDPDTFFKDMRPSEVLTYIESNSKNFIEFRIGLLSASVSDKVKVYNELKSMVNDFPDADARVIIMNDVASKFGLATQQVNTTPKRRLLDHNTNAEINILRISLMVNHEVVFDRLSNIPDIHTFFVDNKLSKLAQKVFSSREIDIHSLLYNDDEDIRSATETILNTGVVYSDPIWDADYHILKFEKYAMELLEKQIFLGKRTESEDMQRQMLAGISQSKKIIDQEMRRLEEIRRNVKKNK